MGGLTNREIAERLVLSARTVETHVARVTGKLGVNSPARAVARAIALGLAAQPSAIPSNYGRPAGPARLAWGRRARCVRSAAQGEPRARRHQPGRTAPDPTQEAWKLESLIGSRVLLGAGLLSLLLGAVFFFKLSSEHHWIPPGVRVLCGLAAGLALLLGGAYLLAKRKTYVAEGLTGLGASVLYLSLWGAYGPLQVLPSYYAAFGAMIAVSVTLALIAWKYRSQNVALAGLLGGYLTPALLNAGPFDRVVLAVYLAVLSAAMLVLAVRCRYRLVEAASFVAALFYAQAFAPSSVPGQEWSSSQSILVATLLFAQFAAALFFAARRDGAVDARRIGLLAAEVLAYAGVLELELGWSPHVLAFADAALGAVLLFAVATRVPASLRLAYAWLGVGMLTRAVAAWGGAHALTMTLAVEGAGLVLVGVRGARLDLRRLGYGALALASLGAGLHLLADVPAHAFFNERTWAALAAALALAAVYADLRAYAPVLAEAESKGIAPLALIGAAGFTLCALSADVVTATAPLGQWTSTTNMLLSALWSLCATALVALGFRCRSPLARYLGIGLFTVTIVKVFVVDLATLDLNARVISFLVLGSVLVAIAGAYQFVLLRGRRTS